MLVQYHNKSTCAPPPGRKLSRNQKQILTFHGSQPARVLSINAEGAAIKWT